MKMQNQVRWKQNKNLNIEKGNLYLVVQDQTFYFGVKYNHSGLYRYFNPFIQFFLNGNVVFYALILKMHCRNLDLISKQ
jgi:hypothetical protein